MVPFIKMLLNRMQQYKVEIRFNKNYGWNCCWKTDLALWLPFLHSWIFITFCFPLGLVTQRQQNFRHLLLCMHTSFEKRIYLVLHVLYQERRWYRRRERMRKREGSVKISQQHFCTSAGHLLFLKLPRWKKEELHNERKECLSRQQITKIISLNNYWRMLLDLIQN